MYNFNGFTNYTDRESNMETLSRIDEAAEHYEAEAAKAATLQQLKEQIARVRAAVAKLDELIGA